MYAAAIELEVINLLSLDYHFLFSLIIFPKEKGKLKENEGSDRKC